MIFSSLRAVPGRAVRPGAIGEALGWIAEHDVAHMEAGTYELQGQDLYVMIQDFTTRPVQDCSPERHNDYLDIQYVVSGVERMGYAPYTGAEAVLSDPEGKDVAFYRDLEGESFVDVGPGAYCVFFSNDIHRPGCAAGQPGPVRKVVVKMRQSLL